MTQEDPLTDEQKRVIASLGMKESTGRKRFRHSPLLVYGILIPVIGVGMLMVVLFFPMLMCSGHSTAAILGCVVMAALRGGLPGS
ncbi:MAG: hypothetical protein VX684_02910 [Planctomycetota bacterium]|nr:hypothetical protein [Planctomycetota bacterium]MEC9233353.1 hypothetical protein [Planctomycetota bacterium]MED5506770.1 hypothetical protein [Planctomycetota bacterium]